MIEIDNKLIADDVFEKKFVCDLSACKGACCVEGDSGAPLEDDELAILDKIYDRVSPFLRPEGRKAINEQGKYIKDWDDEYVTPLIDGKECAYVTFDKNGITKCGIEEAFLAGVIDWKKPISCHLYPIRISKFKNGTEALNYDKWPICKPACSCGEKLDVPVFRFLKEPIIRKYGKRFFKELEIAAHHLEEVKEIKSASEKSKRVKKPRK